MFEKAGEINTGIILFIWISFIESMFSTASIDAGHVCSKYIFRNSGHIHNCIKMTRIPRKASSHLLGQKSQEPQSERGY